LSCYPDVSVDEAKAEGPPFELQSRLDTSSRIYAGVHDVKHYLITSPPFTSST
jgi:hypothetical protein